MSGHLFSVRLSLTFFGGIAQLGEHLPCKQGVSGSNPLTSTNGFLGEIRKRNGPYYLRRATREHSSAG